jgi:hypothetical protein
MHHMKNFRFYNRKFGKITLINVNYATHKCPIFTYVEESTILQFNNHLI